MSPRGRRNRLSSIHAIADELRQSSEAVGTPDFASSILSRVEVQRPFLCERTRQMIWVGRAAVGLSVAVMALGVALRWPVNQPGYAPFAQADSALHRGHPLD